jgi:hypothetical protein
MLDRGEHTATTEELGSDGQRSGEKEHCNLDVLVFRAVQHKGGESCHGEFYRDSHLGSCTSASDNAPR